MKENAAAFAHRRWRWRRISMWLLFFLIVALVLVLTLLSWQRAPQPERVSLIPNRSDTAIAPVLTEGTEVLFREHHLA